MQGSATPSRTLFPPQRRLLLAFVLGIPVGLFFFFNAQSPILQWWVVALPAAVLLVAMIVSILLEPVIRQDRRAALRPLVRLVLTLLTLSVLLLVLALLPAIQPAFGLIVLAMVPGAVGLATAVTIGSNVSLGWAVIGAVVAWLGSSLPILLNAVLYFLAYEKTTPGGDGVIALPLTIAYLIIDFVVAALGGLVGGLFRRWLLRRTSSKTPVLP